MCINFKSNKEKILAAKINKYFIVLFIALAPLMGYADEQLVQQAHRSPNLTTIAIIQIYEGGQFQGIVLIEREETPFAKVIPGGKVEYGETIENAVRCEMMKEVNLELNDLMQFHVYSDPTRDFRNRSVQVAYTAKAFQLPVAGDDAAKAFVVKLEDIPWSELAFNHAPILQDYIEWRDANDSLFMGEEEVLQLSLNFKL